MGLVTDMRGLNGIVRESFPGAWQRNVVVDNRECVLAFSAVFACVTRIANDIAKLRIKLVELQDNDIWVDANKDSPHWLVLRKPNRYQNRIQFLVEWLLMKLLYGNAYVLKERDGRNMVAAMYVLDSRRVNPVVTPDGAVYYNIASDQLSRVKFGGIVSADDIIHDRGATLWHPLCGVSPIYACGASATQGNRIQANSARFFENMSRPGGVLSVPGDIDEPNFDRLKREWNESYSGTNTGKTAVLTNGTKYEAFAIPAQDAQLIEQLRWTVEDVARAFGMPLYKIGAGPVPTSNNVEALQQQYYSDCLQIMIEAVELCLDEGLGMPSNLGTELDLDGLLRMDSATQIDLLAKGVGGAIMMPDEARRKLNMSPVEGGNQVYLQQQNYSLAALAKRDGKEDPFGTAKPTPDPEPATVPEATPTPDGPAAKSIEALVSVAMDAAFARAEEDRASVAAREDTFRLESVARSAAQAAKDAEAAEAQRQTVAAVSEMLERMTAASASIEASKTAAVAETQAVLKNAMADIQTTVAAEVRAIQQPTHATAQVADQGPDVSKFAEALLAGLDEICG